MKKLISLDFDGVLYNLDEIHKKHIKENYGVDYDTNQATYWEYLYDNYPCITKCWTNWDIYKTAPLITGAIDFINKLKDTYGAEAIQIVTSSPESIQKEKTKMIKRVFGIDVIHVTKENKSLFTKGTILVDDGAHNIEDHLKNTPNHGILFDLNGNYGWNKEFVPCERSIRCHSYEETFNEIKKRMKNG